MSNIQQKDLENLINFVNLVLDKAQFNFTAQESLRFAELTVGIKDLKDKLTRVYQQEQIQASVQRNKL